MRRLDAWRRSTISRLLRPAASSTASAVPSLLASTKMISMATVGSTASKRSISRTTLPRSFFVGTTIDSKGSSRRTRPELNLGDSRRGSRTDIVVFDCRADPPSPRRAKWGSDASPR